jgi:integrase
MNKKEILGSEKVGRFINSQHSKNTRIRYEYFTVEYFMFVNANPDTYFVDGYEFLEPQIKQKIASKYKADLQDYKNKLLNEPNKLGRDMKGPSIRTTLSCIKSLFTYYEIDFPVTFWQKLNNFKNERTSITETPSVEQLRTILDNTDIQGKCIFLIMATSGSRIDSVLQLRRKDIDMEHEYPRITFSYKNVKSGLTKVKRVTPECKHFLQSYFSQNMFSDESRLFRMTRQNADYKWKCALKKAKLHRPDDNTGRCTMTTHCLKRFFITNFSKANFGNNEQWADYFAEHRSDLDRRYKDYDERYIDEQYGKGVPFLLVYERPIDADIRIKEITKENLKLKGKLKLMEDKFSSNEMIYEERFQNLEQNMKQALNPYGKNFEKAYNIAKAWVLKNSSGTSEEILSEIESSDQLARNFLQLLQDETKQTGKSMVDIAKDFLHDPVRETNERLEKIQRGPTSLDNKQTKRRTRK